jgi:uncharacterized protein (DUF305 family)
MFTFATRTVALLSVTAATGLAVAGCGSTTSSGSSSTTNATQPQAAGAVDKAFVAQMIPHHQMAVQMASDTPSRGEHPQIKTLGANITRTQDQEIAQMKTIAKKLRVTPAAMPMGTAMSGSMGTDAKALGLSMDQMGMSMDMAALKTATPFDRAFIDEMIPHHQGAIRMARAELAKGQNAQLKSIATGIVAAQKKEITQMNAWRKAWYGSTSPAGGVPTT